jgi:nephrocystin-4
MIEFYRHQTKHDQIMNKLHEFITTEYAIYPNFGVIEFFEYVLTNPFNEPQTFTIIISDPEVQVVTDSREWRHLKILHQIYSQVEDNMFDKHEIDPTKSEIKYQQIYLRPKETINIPLKFQTFRADNRVQNDNTHLKFNSDGSGIIRTVPPKYELRNATVTIRSEDRNPVSILRLVIDQQPHVVTQTFRFYECEHSFLKKNIRIPSSVRALAANSTALLSGDIKLDGTVTDQAMTQLYVRCSDANVVCESRAVTIGEPHDILIKAPTGPSPAIRKFYVAIYADAYLAVPLQIWQVYVHALHRIDVSCLLGQISRFSLILK